MIGIYKITNPKGRIYIGSSKNIPYRWEHYYKRLNCKKQVKLFNSFLKYGYENHTFEVIEECTIDVLLKRENYYGHLFNVLDRKHLNCKLPKANDTVSCISEMTLINMRKAQLGKKASLETRLKQSRSQLGRKHSKITKNKQRLSNQRLKFVLNLETGIFYYGTGDAAESSNINRHTLKNKLNGNKQNDTSFIYV